MPTATTAIVVPITKRARQRMGVVRVKRVIPEADLRRVHFYRTGTRIRGLEPGDAYLYLNRKRDKARLVDFAKAIHNYYAPQGEIFDLQRLQEHASALNFYLDVPAQQATRHGLRERN